MKLKVNPMTAILALAGGIGTYIALDYFGIIDKLKGGLGGLTSTDANIVHYYPNTKSYRANPIHHAFAADIAPAQPNRGFPNNKSSTAGDYNSVNVFDLANSYISN
jgi:hypothetical protein